MADTWPGGLDSLTFRGSDGDESRRAGGPSPGLRPELTAEFSFVVRGLEKIFTLCLLFLAKPQAFLPWLSINNRGVRELLTLPHSVHLLVSARQLWVSFQPHA